MLFDRAHLKLLCSNEYCTDSLWCGFFTPSMIRPSLFQFQISQCTVSLRVNFTGCIHHIHHLMHCCIWNCSYRIHNLTINQRCELSISHPSLILRPPTGLSLTSYTEQIKRTTTFLIWQALIWLAGFMPWLKGFPKNVYVTYKALLRKNYSLDLLSFARLVNIPDGLEWAVIHWLVQLTSSWLNLFW